MAGEFQKSIDFFLASHPDTTICKIFCRAARRGCRRSWPPSRRARACRWRSWTRSATRGAAHIDPGVLAQRTGRRRWSRSASPCARPGTNSSDRGASMIRINLLPVKAAKRREQGQRQLLIGVGGGDAARWSASSSSTARRSRASTSCADQNAQADARHRQAEDRDRRLRHDQAQRDELIRQRDAIRKLQANRAGPVWMMRELSDILTPGKGPTFNKEQYEELIKRDPSAGFNPNWDTRSACGCSATRRRRTR